MILVPGFYVTVLLNSCAFPYQRFCRLKTCMSYFMDKALDVFVNQLMLVLTFCSRNWSDIFGCGLFYGVWHCAILRWTENRTRILIETTLRASSLFHRNTTSAPAVLHVLPECNYIRKQ